MWLLCTAPHLDTLSCMYSSLVTLRACVCFVHTLHTLSPFHSHCTHPHRVYTLYIPSHACTLQPPPPLPHIHTVHTPHPPSPTLHMSSRRLHDVIHADRRLYLVFEYLDLDLKKLMDGMPTFSSDHRLIKVSCTIIYGHIGRQVDLHMRPHAQ